MPPQANSRNLFCEQLTDSQGRIYLSEREPFGFVDLADNRRHKVIQGDTLWGLAARAFPGQPHPEMLYWVICDFQVPPIRDATIALEPGSVLVIPSERTYVEQIQNPSRAQAA